MPSQARLTPKKRSLEKREVMLTYRQLGFLWLFLSVVIGLAFVFGLYAGRKQGAEIALEERGGAMVRLPLDDSGVVNDARGASSSKGSALTGASSSPNALSGKNGEPPAETFDFGSAQVVNTAPLRDRNLDRNVDLNRDRATRAESGGRAPGFSNTASSISGGGTPLAGAGRGDSSLNSGVRSTGGERQAAGQPAGQPVGVQTQKSASHSGGPSGGGGGASLSSLERQKTRSSSPNQPLKSEQPTTSSREGASKGAPRAEAPKTARWRVQVASPKSSAEAQQIARKLRARGVTATVEQVKTREGSAFRVVTSTVRAREEAEQLSRKISKFGVAGANPVARSVP